MQPSCPVPPRGTALTPLRPVGKARFGGDIVEVTAVGPMVEPGASVVVVRASPYAVEVEEVCA